MKEQHAANADSTSPAAPERDSTNSVAHERDQLEKLVEELQQHKFELSQQNEELRRAHDELNRVTNKFRDLWHHAPIGYLSHDRNGSILAFNERASELLSVVRAVVEQTTLQSFLDQRSRDVFRQHLSVVASSSAAVAAEVRLATVDHQEECWLQLESLVDAQGEYRTALIDVSAQKRAEKERVALASQLRQSKKMEVLHELSAGIAHDFNNMLQVILSYGEILRDTEACENRVRIIDGVLDGARQGADLTRRLLAFSRRSPLQTKPMDVCALVDNVVNVGRRTFGEHIRIHTALGPSVACAIVDGSLVEQAIMNLCMNARDAMPDGGNLAIHVDHQVLTKPMLLNGCRLAPGKYVMVEVADDGVGMSSKTREKAFEPFFTTKDVGTGTGLGLAIVYGIVRQHGGAIGVDSDSGSGSRFTMLLPATDAPLKEQPTVAENDAQPCRTGGAIMLVEDEASIRLAVPEVLRQAGFTVLAPENGSEAIELLGQAGEQIDLVITDVRMPDVSGKDVCEAAHACRSDMPVIFLTGHGDSVIDADFLSAHQALLLNKPIGAHELLDAVCKRLPVCDTI